jgi:hypothetical protein
MEKKSSTHLCQGHVRQNPINPYAKGQKRLRYSRVSVAKINKKAKVEMKECPECGNKKEAAGMVWCDCNPSAPFRMGPASISNLVNAVIRKTYNLK